MGLRRTPDAWTAPPKEDRVAAKKDEEFSKRNLPTVNEELSRGEMDRSLPEIDMHGEFPEAVPRLIDNLIAGNGNAVVRIVTGKGTGVLMRATQKYLNELLIRRNSPISGFRSEAGSNGASFVVRVK